jgi:transposase-like protein
VNTKKEKSPCPKCRQATKIKRNGTTSGKKQKFFCGLCNTHFVGDTHESEEHRQSIEARLAEEKEVLDECPQCKSSHNVKKNGFRYVEYSYTDHKIQRHFCTVCKVSFSEPSPFSELKRQEREAEEMRLLNMYIVYLEDDLKPVKPITHIPAFFVGKIAEHLGTTKRRLRYIREKHKDKFTRPHRRFWGDVHQQTSVNNNEPD